MSLAQKRDNDFCVEYSNLKSAVILHKQSFGCVQKPNENHKRKQQRLRAVRLSHDSLFHLSEICKRLQFSLESPQVLRFAGSGCRSILGEEQRSKNLSGNIFRSILRDAFGGGGVIREGMGLCIMRNKSWAKGFRSQKESS